MDTGLIAAQQPNSTESSGSPPPFRPTPKPRKSLMNNTTAACMVIPPTHQANNTAAAVSLPADPKGQPFPLYKLPPPLPPRTAFSSSSPLIRPLPPLPERIDFSTPPLTSSPTEKKSNSSCINGINKIYPCLEDLFDHHQKFTTKTTTTNPIPMDVASNSSDFSSSDDYHSVLDSPQATVKSSAAYNSFYEPFGDVKSDGESVCFSGWVQLTPQGIIKHKKRGWAMIRKGQFFISPDDESDSPFFGPVNLCKCVYLGRTTTISNGDSKEITLIIRNYTTNGKHQKGGHTAQSDDSSSSMCTLRFTPEENGDYWLLLLAKQCCAPRNDLLDECMSLDCFGKLWFKQGISGIWNEGWAFVDKRVLHYWIEGPTAPAQVDIRKIILIKRKDISISDWCNRIENSTQGPILIAMEGSSLYLQAHNDQCTTIWLDFLTAELKKEADTLEECRLTSDDIPVIVDKCIRLISTYGMYQQGIYRKSGSAAEAKKLIAAFREDPYAVHLKSPITDDLCFAVAGVLRTFFRQLNSPLIPVHMHAELYEISNLQPVDKPQLYKQLIYSLPKVYFKTLKKLLGHLHEIISHEDRNFASLDNISKIFGPTIFNMSNSDEEVSVEWYTMATKQTHVMRDLIFHYCELFGVSADELLAKCKLDVIQEQKSSKNPATGLLLPIHLFEKDNKCFNIQSEWTAGQVVAFKIEKLAFVSPIENYALFEMIRNGQLERRIGANESLRSIVLGRWLDWEDHQNNYLLLKRDLHPFQPQIGRAFADDIKIAEPGSRTFKSASLRIEEGTRVCQYSVKSMKRQNDWKVDEMLWFIGAEAERKCPLPFALTFFVCGDEKKATTAAVKCRGKLPGWCVAFKDEVQRHQWLNCICLNQSEYLPQPLIQI